MHFVPSRVYHRLIGLRSGSQKYTFGVITRDESLTPQIFKNNYFANTKLPKSALIKNRFENSRCLSGQTNLKCLDQKRYEYKHDNSDESSYHYYRNIWRKNTAGLICAATILAYGGINTTDDTKNKENTEHKRQKYEAAIKEATNVVKTFQAKIGAPGICVAVTVDGETVWSTGFGYADVENGIDCTSKTVMRIASISKPIAMAVIARLMDQNKINIDLPIEHYVKEWPKKIVKNENVSFTTRQVASHLSGIRHYDVNCGRKTKQSEKSKRPEESKEKKITTTVNSADGDSRYKEFFMNRKFNSTQESMELFKDDELCHKPGTKFLYTTHGYTMLSAVAESVTNKKVEDLLQDLFKALQMKHTYLDKNEPVIQNRSRFYQRDKTLHNAPAVDCSYKWTGGGLLSTVDDLTTFGNVMLYSFQHTQDHLLEPFIQPATVKDMWTPMKTSEDANKSSNSGYGLGWSIKHPDTVYGGGKSSQKIIHHSGAAVGSSTMLMILPCDQKNVENKKELKPRGLTVAIMCNLEQVRLHGIATQIIEQFANCDKAS